MREFISGIAFLLAFLTMVMMIIGLISPEKIAEKGKPALTRKNILLYFIFATSILISIGVVILPSNGKSTVSQQDSDAVKLQKLRAEISAVEDQCTQQLNDFSNTLKRLYLKKEVSSGEQTKPVGVTFGEMLETLEKANGIKVPDITQADAKRYATDAVDAHKKWALTMQAKIVALSKGDMEQIKAMGARADNFAMDEAVALGLAYKALGLPIQ